MRSSKLYHFLHRLPERQRAAFLRFLDSPYHNKKKELFRLAEVVHNRILPYKNRNLTEEETYELLFPGSPYNKIRFRKLKTETLELLHRFLELQAFERDVQQRHLMRLRQLNTMQEDRFFEQACRQAFKALEPIAETIHGLEQRRLLLMERYTYEIRQPQRRPPNTISEARDMLLDYEAALEIRFAYLSLNQSLVTGQPSGLFPYPEAWKRIRDRFDVLPAEAKGYFLLLNAIQDFDDDSNYLLLKDLLDFGGESPPAWSRDLVTAALNHASRIYNKGNEAYVAEIHEWYQRALVDGILIQNGRLLASHLKNAVSVASKLGHHDYANQLVELHADHLLGDHQQNARTYNLGVIALYRRDYREAISLFNLVLADYQDHFYGLDARILMLQACYLGEESQLAESLVHATRMFVKRHQHLSYARKKRYWGFVRYFTRLLECPPHDRKRLDKLRKDLLQKAAMPAKNWLLEQVDLLLDRAAV